MGKQNLASTCAGMVLALAGVVGGEVEAELHAAATGGGGPEPAAEASAFGGDTMLDIILVIDNSGSMGPPIASLQDQLYDHLVAPLIAIGLDTRVIVVSRHGDLASESVCFEVPLSSVPPGGCDTPPFQPGLTDGFKHYSVEVGSLDAWCLLLSTYDGSTPDEFGLAPNGWLQWLRSDALKLVIAVSDDGIACGSYDDGNSVAGGTTAAAAFDSDLLALSPTHFGTSDDRNYVAHSLVGLAPNTPPDEPWPPTSPITTAQCAGSVSPGTGHQGLAILTGGLRFPVCATVTFDTFLDAVSSDTLSRVPIFADGFESGDTSAWSHSVP